MATTENQLRRELLTEISATNKAIDKLLAVAVASIAVAARNYKNDPKRFQKAVLTAIAVYWASYALLTKTSNKAVAQAFVTYVDNTVGVKMLKVGAVQSYIDQTQQLPTAVRPKGDLQLKLEAAHNAGNKAEEARLNKLVDASMRTDAGMSTKVRDEFLKAMRAGKPITMAEAQKRAGEAASSKYADTVEKTVLSRKNPFDNKSTAQRIVTLKKGNEKIVRDLITQGIDKHLSVNQLARSIQQYIDPLSQAGKRFTAGNAVDYRAVQAGKKLPKGSIRYNAVRIARSEIMQTYDRAAEDYYKDQPYFTGWNWFLSNTHTGFDDCDTLANSNPHKTMPDRPHPQCTCDVRPNVASLSEFERLVKSGAIH